MSVAQLVAGSDTDVEVKQSLLTPDLVCRFVCYGKGSRFHLVFNGYCPDISAAHFYDGILLIRRGQKETRFRITDDGRVIFAEGTDQQIVGYGGMDSYRNNGPLKLWDITLIRSDHEERTRAIMEDTLERAGQDLEGVLLGDDCYSWQISPPRC